jgi:hypothetical protein
MKQLLWIAVLCAACNNADNAVQPIKNDSLPVATQHADACSKLIFFRSGAELGFKSYDAKGKVIGSQITKIRSVKNEGGFTIATVESTDSAGTEMKYDYKCDGKAIYFDLAALMQSATTKSGTTVEGSLIEYPIDVSAGQTLPDASGTMTMEQHGKKTTMTYYYKDRTVKGKENVTTPAGTWSCYKITNRIEVKMEFPGMDERTKKMMETMTNQMKTTSTTWFSPDFGIVKMETHQNGKLQFSNEIVSVKR